MPWKCHSSVPVLIVSKYGRHRFSEKPTIVDYKPDHYAVSCEEVDEKGAPVKAKKAEKKAAKKEEPKEAK